MSFKCSLYLSTPLVVAATNRLLLKTPDCVLCCADS